MGLPQFLKVTLLITVLMTPAASAIDLLFDTRIDYGRDINPESTCSDDFDGDGYQDLAAANNFDDNVSIYFSNGDGGFQPPIDYAVEDDPRSIVTADFNSDTYPDLAVVNNEWGGWPGSLSILLNNGNGTFNVLAPITLGAAPQFLVYGDFDGDSDIDLAVSHSSTASLKILYNNGNGVFAVAHSLGNSRCGALICRDFDGDLDLDIVADMSFGVTDSLYVMLNNGDGSFADRVAFSYLNFPIDIVGSDYDNDNDIDLAVCNINSNRVQIYANDGDAGFTSIQAIDLGLTTKCISESDVDGDMDLDLLVGAQGTAYVSPELYVLENDGSSLFTNIATYYPATTPQDISGIDVDNDNDEDIVLFTENIGVFYNKGDGSYISPSHYNAPDTPDDVVSGDFDNDGDFDLVATMNDKIYFCENTGDGTYQNWTQFDFESGISHSDVADLNQDGDLDIVVAKNSPFYGKSFRIYYGNGDGTFQYYTQITVANEIIGLHLADLDGDNFPDLSLTLLWGGVSVYINDGTGYYSSFASYSGPHGNIHSGDLDGDLDLDLIISRTGHLASAYIYLNNGDGSFQDAIQHVASGSGGLHSMSIADLNGDSYLDFVGVASGDLYVSINNGDATFLDPVAYVVPDGFGRLVTADFDRDNDVDIALGYWSAHDVSSITILNNNGDGTFVKSLNYGISSYSLFDLLAVNVDGDCDVDIIAVNAGMDILINQKSEPGVWACGDANCDGIPNVGDAVYMINYVFKFGPEPLPFVTGDVNCDGIPNVGDAVYLINFVFKGGPQPCDACP